MTDYDGARRDYVSKDDVLALLVETEKTCVVIPRKQLREKLYRALRKMFIESDTQRILSAIEKELLKGDEKSGDEPYLERREREDLLEEMGDGNEFLL